LSHLAFKSAPLKGSSFDHTKPLYVPAGSDSLAQIGSPSHHVRDIKNALPTYEDWRVEFLKIFPQEKGIVITEMDVGFALIVS
jgi:hypothetical protein